MTDISGNRRARKIGAAAMRVACLSFFSSLFVAHEKFEFF